LHNAPVSVGEPARVDVLGCPIDPLDMRASVARCEQIIESRRATQLVAINASKLIALRGDQRLRRIVERCELVHADGQSVVWASRLLGAPIPERVPGIELMFEVLALAERKGYRVYILGAREHVLETAVGELRRRYPRLVLCGSHHGYFTENDEAKLAEEIARAEPDILMVAMSSPRKEYWLAEHGRTLGAPLNLGVGGSIDVVAGVTARAPEWMQRIGMEWFFRLVQEPQRLARRYAVTNTQFIGLLATELVRAKTTRR
jgi:N-acetylglucosaminyldiphosphoundecaprenol N-acetyl-beta-D-mannosaminyltransferase